MTFFFLVFFVTLDYIYFLDNHNIMKMEWSYNASSILIETDLIKLLALYLGPTYLQ